MNKKKIINDPVYGFITIQGDLIFDIIEHPVFQRLRRIKQLGLTDLVYPGALHTRFHHAIGAMHLMAQALDNLRGKGHHISEEEYEASLIAILLHDVGHAPFSHALEFNLLSNIRHEDLSTIIIKSLNKKFNGALTLALSIFEGTYKRNFFHQLVSSQLDVDRLDYLRRDSFFTGVSEGTIGVDRIIKMLNIKDDNIVVEEKGIYSVENFLNSRRLMYWQVYLHKTTVSSEKMIIQLISRAKYLMKSGQDLFASEALAFFLKNELTLMDFNKTKVLDSFMQLDDYDIWGAIKIWQSNGDLVLSELSQMLLDRRLFRVKLSNEPIPPDLVDSVKRKVAEAYSISAEDAAYFMASGSMSNAAYMSGGTGINILTKTGALIDIAEASDLPNIRALGKIVRKYYLCSPKNVYL